MRYCIDIGVEADTELKVKKFREIMRVVYKMLELNTLVESEIYERTDKKYGKEVKNEKSK